MFEKLGKARMRQLLHQQTGFALSDIRDVSRYEFFGNKEVLNYGAHSVVNNHCGTYICMPCSGKFDTGEIRYVKKWIQRREPTQISHTREPSSQKEPLVHVTV